MPQARRSTGTTSRPRALDRLEKAIDAAQAALKDLRTELGRGGRDLVKDLEKTLSDSRKNMRSLSKTVVKDFEKLQKAAAPPRPRAARGAAGARKATTKTTRSSSAKK